MIRIQRYLLGELLSAFLLLTGIVTGVFVTGSLLQFLHRYGDLGLVAMLRVLPYMLPSALLLTVPMSFLIACLLTYGRFADDNEFLAMRMGGIRPWHAIAPALLAGLALTFGTLHLNSTVTPLANLAAKEITTDQAGQLLRSLRDPGATRIKLGRRFEMSWGGRGEGGWVEDVLITMRERKRDPATGKRIDTLHVIWADRARLQPPDEEAQVLLELEGAEIERPDARGERSWIHYAQTSLKFGFVTLAGLPESMKSKGKDERRSEALLYSLERGSPNAARTRELATEYWWRVSIGLAPLMFGFVGSLMGLVTARGSRAAAAMQAVFLALPVYYPMMLLGAVLSEGGSLPPPVALNLGNLLLLAIGCGYAFRMGRV